MANVSSNWVFVGFRHLKYDAIELAESLKLKGKQTKVVKVPGVIGGQFGRYFHSPHVCSYARTDQGTLEHYGKHGWECIILWDDHDDESWIKEVMNYAR